MTKLKKSNLARATVLKNGVARNDVKGYFLSYDVFVAFPADKNEKFERYFVPRTEIRMEECEEKHLPYVESATLCKGFDYSFDGNKKELEKYNERNYIPYNDTLEKLLLIDLDEEIVIASYLSASAASMDEEFILKKQIAELKRRNGDKSYLVTQEDVSTSISVLKYSQEENMNTVTPLVHNPNAVYTPYKSYSLYDSGDMIIQKITRPEWSSMSDYEINGLLDFYEEYKTFEKNETEIQKSKRLNNKNQ